MDPLEQIRILCIFYEKHKDKIFRAFNVDSALSTDPKTGNHYFSYGFLRDNNEACLSAVVKSCDLIQEFDLFRPIDLMSIPGVFDPERDPKKPLKCIDFQKMSIVDFSFELFLALVLVSRFCNFYGAHGDDVLEINITADGKMCFFSSYLIDGNEHLLEDFFDPEELDYSLDYMIATCPQDFDFEYILQEYCVSPISSV